MSDISQPLHYNALLTSGIKVCFVNRKHSSLVRWGNVTGLDVAKCSFTTRFGVYDEAIVISGVQFFKPLMFSVLQDYIPSPCDYGNISSTRQLYPKA